MRSTGWIATLIILMVGFNLALAQGTDDLARQGKEVYINNCADCHRTNGQGLPAKFPALVNNAFVLGDPNLVIDTVLNGRRGELGRMPAWKNKLGDREIAALVTYIRQAWSNQAPGITTEMVAVQRKK